MFKCRRVALLKTSRNRSVTLAHLIDETRHRAVGRREIGRDRDEVEICPGTLAYADAFRAIMIAFVIATFLVPLLRNIAAAKPASATSH